MSYIEHFQFCRVVEPGFCCCVEIDGALPVGLKIFPKLWQDLDGFEASLSQVLPHLRKQRLNKVAEHIHSCPICQQCVWILLDGKQGARRFICAGLESRGSSNICRSRGVNLHRMLESRWAQRCLLQALSPKQFAAERFDSTRKSATSRNLSI
jgi:hypothetical protein